MILCLGSEPLQTFHHHPSIPASIEDRDLTRLGQAAPETVKVLARRVLALRRSDGVYYITAWIQPFGHPFDVPPFAGCVPALIDHNDWTLLNVDLVTQIVQCDLIFNQ